MKDEIRKKLIEMRKNLDKKEIFKKSNQIKKRLYDMNEFKQSKSILFYVSYDNEVYTHDMIKEGISKKIDIIIPVIDKKDSSLILSKLVNWANLKTGSYGILEKSKDNIKEYPLENVDLIIVPGIGFDESGNRIGHGKGYYDNLLKKSAKAYHIGLAFEKQIINKIPIDNHDIPLHKVITEDRVINCRNSK
jgi:5-formyltetrahydrofolate cyclo-ligase